MPRADTAAMGRHTPEYASAKNANADFKISLALRNSLTSRASLRITACSGLVVLGG